MFAPPASLSGSAHRYAHLYPPVSFFHLSDDPHQQAAGHVSNYSMVWCMLHGVQPPLHLFASSLHAAAIEAGESANQQRSINLPTGNSQASGQTTVETRIEHSREAEDEKMSGTEESSVPAAGNSVPDESVSPVDLQPTIGPHGAEYSREQLIALYTPHDEIPAPLTAAASSSWFASCLSTLPLPPVCASPADALQSKLQDELARDAELTGVPEYAGEWWIASYGEIAKARGQSSRGRGRGGTMRGRGGGRGGGSNFKPYQPQTYTHKKTILHQPAPSASSNMEIDGAPAAAAPAAAATGPSAAVAALGGGRRSKKRPASASTDPATDTQLAPKRLYSETNISKLFVGPTMPPAPSAPAASSSSSSSLPSKEDLYSATTQPIGANDAAITNEIMRNIQLHQQQKRQLNAKFCVAEM